MVGLFSRTVVAATVRMPKWFVGWVSRRYVAGSTIEDAVRIMKRLSKEGCLLYTSPSPRDLATSRMPSAA